MDNSSGDTTVLALTVRIVAAHVGNNDVDADALPALIRAVYNALAGTADDTASQTIAAPPHAAAIPTPAVPIVASVFNDHIVCLEDGKKQKTLKRHLQSAHGLTPDAYRARWGLPGSYPMVAPAYAETRSALAKSIGLGTKRLPQR
ncbi:MAG: MucR family transcriptional regulator [Rhodospirillales bacterium]